MKKLSGFLLLFVFLCCSLSAKETQIIIFSTNDMHGSIDNFAKIASYIQKERAKNPNILILSGGEICFRVIRWWTNTLRKAFL